MDLMQLLRADPEGKGPRPYFFADPAVERVLGVALALAEELAVTRQRLDTLERDLVARGIVPAGAVEAHAHSADAEAERQRWQQDYLARVLRALLDDSPAVRRAPEPPAGAGRGA
jgi:hypothetical protein